MFRLVGRAKDSGVFVRVSISLLQTESMSGQRGMGSSLKVDKGQIDAEQKKLSHKAKSLSLSLYRTVLRSTRLLSEINENDKRDFKKREEKRNRTLEDRSSDDRLNMISMLPALDTEDELRSRVLYYKQYAYENFAQESDCLDTERWDEEQVKRFTKLLKRGEKHRKWLLSDMKFQDPYDKSFDLKRVEAFEIEAIDFARRASIAEGNSDTFLNIDSAATNAALSDDDDGWGTEDEDDDENEGLPAWYKNPRNE